jgi:hypothetical protein
MALDYGRLTVERLIVHEIPWHPVTESSGPGPTLSEAESPLDQEIKNFFRQRIAGSLGRASFDIEFDPGATSPVPGIVTAALDRTGDFVASSQEVARHLYQSQKGSSPVGLLTVLEVKIQGRLGFCILKLEKEEGARVLEKALGGKKTLTVDLVKQLMLSDKMRVFKVGLFVSQGRTAVEAVASDNQVAMMADFFLRQFLGCRLKELPDVTTKRFLEAAESFVNEDVSDGKDRAKYQIALLADMGSTRTQVRPRTFATENLKVAHRQAFETRIAEAGVPATAFPKDTRLIRKHLDRIKMDFESGVIVLASPAHIGEQVKVEDLKDGRTKVEVTDRLKEIHGRSR